MDGVNFLIQTVDVLIHDDLSIKSLLPALLDMRSLKLDTLQLVSFIILYIIIDNIY